MNQPETTAVRDVVAELAKARAKFGAMTSAHEGIAIIEEEFIELRNEVFWGPTDGSDAPGHVARRVAMMRAEAVQLAAMALRFIEDVCDA